MPNNTETLQLAIVAAFAVLVLGFILFVNSGGVLDSAIDKAIEEHRVILGMSMNQVSASWGSPRTVKDQTVQALGIDTLASTIWTYRNPERTVHFSSEGVVIWVSSSGI